MSEPHTFASATWISAAPGVGSGTGYSRISNPPLSCPTHAASFAVSAIVDTLLRAGITLRCAAGYQRPQGSAKPPPRRRPLSEPLRQRDRALARHVAGVERSFRL